MPSSITDKLRIKPNDVLLTLNAPDNFERELGKLPAGVTIKSQSKSCTQVHWFVCNKAQLKKEVDKVMKLVKSDVLIWVYYPKGSSKIQTDLTRDKGWECLQSESDKLTWINLISFNETWSVFGFRAKSDMEKKKDAVKKPEREIFNWVNPATKEVKLPDDLILAFGKCKKEAAYFDTLSFTNKKEYIEWIVTAKRDETRKERISGTIERLGKQWKNPRNG